jgi:class I fructose-bisphosphate aldolase
MSRILFHSGLRNGTALVLPYHHGLVSGLAEYLANPRAADPRYAIELAIAANLNAVALPIGLAEKYAGDYAGSIPLIVTLNGAMTLADGSSGSAPVNSGVDEAVRLGADAVGFTLGPGAWERALLQLRQVRVDAARLGMPLFCWVQLPLRAPRPQQAAAHAARAAAELGADAAVIGLPAELPVDPRQASDDIVLAAGRTLVLLGAGPRTEDIELISRLEAAMRAGAVGMAIGRNLLQRSHDAALRLAGSLRRVLEDYPSEP